MADSTATSGIIVIITSPDGIVQASCGDFNASAPGGYSLRDAQQRRATEKAWIYVAESHCSGYFAKAFFEAPEALRSVSARLRADGWRVTDQDMSLAEAVIGGRTP